MNKLVAAVLLLPSLAFAQVQVDIALPQIHFDVTPPLVQVSTGVQVVENYSEEVYFVDGFYWVRRDGRWFKSADHRGSWVVVEQKIVPVTIVQLPPGKYKHWKGKKGEVVPASHHDGHHDDHHGGKHKGGKGKKK
jgi:hypothetical protein